MSNPHFAITSKTKTYCEAISATEGIEPPSLGFIKPGEHPGSSQGIAALIRQNNTQIQLLVQIAETLQDIKKELHTLTCAKSHPIPDSLVTKLQNLSLGPTTRPREGKGKLRVFKDPYKILQEENEKLKK